MLIMRYLEMEDYFLIFWHVKEKGLSRNPIFYPAQAALTATASEDVAAQTEDQDRRTTYIGETSRNIYSRGKEHAYKYRRQG